MKLQPRGKHPKHQLRLSRKWYSPEGWCHQKGIMVKSHHDWKDIFKSYSSNRTKTAQVMASYGSLKKKCSVLTSLRKENREIQGNKFPNEDASYSIILMAEDRLWKRRSEDPNKKEESLTSDWSLDDRRRRVLRRRSRHFFSRSSFGRHWRVARVLKDLWTKGMM